MSDTNMPAYTETLRLAKLVGTNTSTLRKNKRELYRNAIVAVAVEQSQPATVMLDQIKSAAKYSSMDKADQALFRREMSNIRIVLENWPRFTAAQREAFANGTIADPDNAKAFEGQDEWPASVAVNTLAGHCKAFEKARDKAPDADGDTDGEAAPTPDAEPDAAPDAAPDCETFTIEQMVAMILAGDDRTLAIHEAVETFNAAAVEATGTNG